MGKYKYHLHPHPKVIEEDLPKLPPELRNLYFEDIKEALRKKPSVPKGFGHHPLNGELKGYLALEVEWDNNPNAYRLVYKIVNSPSPRHVKVISFAEHNPAYEAATERLEQSRSQLKARKRQR